MKKPLREEIIEERCRHDNAPLFRRYAKANAEAKARARDSYYYDYHDKCYACGRIYMRPEAIRFPSKPLKLL